MNSTLTSPLLNSWDLDELRYSFVWEDINCLLGAVPSENLRILSIGSSGENAFSLLLTDPKEIHVIDLSPAQASLLQLKKTAIQMLDFHDFMLLFWGTCPVERRAIYGRLREHLSQDIAGYWDQHISWIETGVQHHGRLDKYFQKFRQTALPKIWNQESLSQLLSATSLQIQAKAWQQGDQRKLKQLASEFFSRTALSEEGRHISQFKYVEQENLGPVFLGRFLKLVTTQLISQNPYIYYFLSGMPLKNHPESIPIWNETSFQIIKDRVHRIQIEVTDLEGHLERYSHQYDFMNLSDIFEYLSPEETEQLFAHLTKALNPQGRIVYWCLLVERAAPCKGLVYNDTLSEELTSKDRTWFYSRVNVIQKSTF